MRMKRQVTALVSGLLAAGCSVVGVRGGTEEPHYTVAGRVGAVEIRQYGTRIAAETTLDVDEASARSAGFRRVAGYIFGGNKGRVRIAMITPVAQSAASETIAMTAPVSQLRDASGRWVIRFYMPAEYTMATLPTPNDDAVRLVEVPPETMGVLRFSGSTSIKAVDDKRTDLLAMLRGSAWQPVGMPVAWFYDPPWTLPFLRRNEVAVTVQAAAS